MREISIIGDQSQKIREYIKIRTRFSQKSEEILKEYNNLSDENKKKASVEAQRIFMAQGVAGIMEFSRNMVLKNI